MQHIISVETDVEAVMRDGTVLRADVYRPHTDAPVPVLVARSPYDKSIQSLAAMLGAIDFAKLGFIVVIQDTRGRFASEGEWDPWTYEGPDTHDTVEWAATLPGANGSVGTIGPSYLGNTQWMGALEKPPSLKAISPNVTFADPDDGLYSRGGAAELGIEVAWSLLQGIDTLMKRHPDDPGALLGALRPLVHDFDHAATATYWELPSGEYPVLARHGIKGLGHDRARREPEWSRTHRVAGRQAEVDVAALHTGGWFDVFVQGTLDNYMAMRAAGKTTNLIVGPWTHVDSGAQIGDVNFGVLSAQDLMGFRGSHTAIQAHWFRSLLNGGDAPADARPVPDLPPVLLFVMGINQWREEQEWPLARAVDTDVFLRADGVLSFDAPADEGNDSFAYDPTAPVPTTGGAILLASEFRKGPVDQSAVESRDDVLVYTSDPLAENLEVTGRVRATVHGTVDAESTDWVVRLCDVDPDGLSRNVVDGILRTDSSDGTEHVIDLWSTSHVFLAGHRLRVHVTASSFPRWDRNPLSLSTFESNSKPIEHRVEHHAGALSRVTLPVAPTR